MYVQCAAFCFQMSSHLLKYMIACKFKNMDETFFFFPILQEMFVKNK